MLDTEFKEILDQASKAPKAEDIFSVQPKKNVNARDIFSGPEELFELIDSARTPNVAAEAKKAVHAGKDRARKLFTTSQNILIANVVIITIILLLIMLKPSMFSAPALPDQNIVIEPSEKILNKEQLNINDTTADMLEEAASWPLGEKLYAAGNYNQGYYVYTQLLNKLNTNIPSDEYLRDFIKLKMALCLEKTEYAGDVSELYQQALSSRSPVVATLANYNMMFREFRQKNYLESRKRAYKTLALCDTIKNHFPKSVESDCYFVMAESVTRMVFQLHNEPDNLPGQLWSDTITIHRTPQMDQPELSSFLQTGVYNINEGVLTPRIDRDTHLNIGSQWTIASVNCPLADVLSRFSNEAKTNVIWPLDNDRLKNMPTTVYLPNTSELKIAEITAGSNGLISRLDQDAIYIHDPRQYEDLVNYQNLLTSEGIAVWRRFLLRYSGDHRMPNAHFALGVLSEYAEESAASLGEYRIVSNRYPHNPLSPFALLNSSMVKIDLKDYVGAAEDLQEIIVHYPDCRIVDQANLYLAEATMNKGMYKDAIGLFRKAYTLNTDPTAHRQAAFGLGRCYYELGQYENAKKWLAIAIEMTTNPADHRIRSAFYLLGMSQMHLKEFKQASNTLKKAIDASAPQEAYIDTILELVKAETKQENFVDAMNILQNISTVKLSQPYVTRITGAKVKILREIDLIDAAITLLRRKLEFISEFDLRAELMYELAICHKLKGSKEDLKIARGKLTDAIYDISPGELMDKCRLELAEVCLKLELYDEAIKTSGEIISDTKREAVKKSASRILGDTYTEMGDYEKAAQAYGGVVPEK